MSDLPPKPDVLAPDIETLRKTRLADGVDQWGVWRYEWQDGRDEWAKIPKDATTGRNARSNDPSTWTDFESAADAYESGEYDGFAFFFHEDGPFVGVDYDDARDAESDRPLGGHTGEVMEIMRTVDSFTYVSTSATGYHTIAEGFVPGGGNRADLPGEADHLEMYDSGRFFAITGVRDSVCEDTPADIESRASEVYEIHREYIADGDESAPSTNETAPSEPVDLEDQELLEKAKNAENGDEFRRLWNGDTSMHSNDHSRADLALCGYLAFWTGGDRQRMDRLFRDSGLDRDKWERDDYRKLTIDKALEGRTEFYDPDSASGKAPATDGGAAATASGPDVGSDGVGEVLTQSMLRSCAGLTGDDDKIADLNDREKAAHVWALVKESGEVHVRVNRENDEIWAFDPGTGTWNPDGERALRHAARKTLGSVNYGSNVLEELKAQIRADIGAEVWGDEFGLKPGKVAVKNGLLDLEKVSGDGDALRDLEPSDYALTRLPVEYDPNADGAEWRSFIDDVVEDDMIDAVQEYIGYCLHRESTFDRAMLLVGGGANGKSTFLNVIEELLDGDDHTDNTANISPYDFGDKPSMAELHGTLANISADLAGGSLQGKNLGNFKKLTGGDTVTAKRLYKDPFKFTYDGGMLFAANEVPDVPVSDDDAAFWRRWIIVHFDNYFPEGSDKRDPTLEGRLKESENLSAVLNWAIEGWVRLLENGEFTNVPSTPDETRRKWQKWGDSVEEFLSDVAVRDPDAENISTGEAFEVYRAWCRVNDRDAVGRQKFTTRAKNADVDLGYAGSTVRTKRSTVPVRGYAAFGTADTFPDPLSVLEDDGDDEDDDGGHNAGLESFDGADETDADEDSSKQSDDVVEDDVDGDGGDRDDEGDTNSLEGKPLGPHIVQYVRENQTGRDGVPRDELVEVLTERGAAEKTVDHWIDKCLECGDIHEPAEDTYTA